jgi:large subunit ribosomal protein L19
MTNVIIQQLEKEKIELSGKISSTFNSFRPGELVKVTFGSSSAKGKRQSFQGVCIAIRHRGISSSFTLRNHLSGEGVEYTFYPYSTQIADLQIIEQNKPKKDYRRAKLYYLRERTPKESSI